MFGLRATLSAFPRIIVKKVVAQIWNSGVASTRREVLHGDFELHDVDKKKGLERDGRAMTLVGSKRVISNRVICDSNPTFKSL